MRRDHFDLTVEGVETGSDAPRKPLVRIDFHGPEGVLEDHLSTADGDLLSATEIDVAYRLRADLDGNDPVEGVVAVTNRLTGDFVLELNESSEDVLPFIAAARAYGRSGNGDAKYRVEITVDGDHLVSYEKGTLLVYDFEGNLLRGESLIPSGVEL